MKDFKKYYILNATPSEVYLALTNPNTIRLWSGDLAEMSEEIDSEFSLWDGSIVGKNISFEKDKSIIQQWYFGSQLEKSMVTFKLHPHKKGTSVELIHTNIPDQEYNDISQGWDDMYFGSLIEFYED